MHELPNLSELSDEELNGLYKLCFKEGHTNLFDLPGHKFGAASLVEEEVFRRRLKAEGWKPKQRENSIFAYDTLERFEISRRRVEFHKNDSHYNEYSTLRAPAVKVYDSFTVEELEHIIEHFSNANDPFVVSLVAKAQRMLDEIPN